MSQLNVDLIVNAITQGFKETQAELIRLHEATNNKKALDESALKWTELMSKVNAAKAAFTMVEGAIRTTWDALNEGAQLELTAQRFDKLAASVGSSGDHMLDALQKTTRGMMSSADLMANAGQIISLGLGKNEEEVVRLSTVVAKLGWNMQQVILTFANQSEKRLDSLGLSIEDVRTRAAALEAQGYSMEKAFSLAVIEAGEAKIRLLGDAADSTAGDLAVLSAQFKELKQNALEAWAGMIGPVATAASGRYGETVSGIIDENIAVAESMDDLIAYGQRIATQLNKGFGLAAAITGTEGALNQGVADSVMAMAGMAHSAEELSAAIEAAFTGRSRNAARAFVAEVGGVDAIMSASASGGLRQYTDELERLAQAGRQGLAPIADLGASIRATNRLLAEHGMGVRMDTRELEDLAYATGDLGNAQERMQKYLEEDRQKLGEAADAAKRYADALASVTAATIGKQFGIIDELASQFETLRESQGEWVQTTRDTSSQIDEINKQLAADLTDEQRKAWQEVAKNAEEGSARWLEAMRALDADLGTSARNDLLIARAELEAAMGQPISVFTGDYAGMEEAQKRIEELTAEMQQNYAQAVFEASMAGQEFDSVAADTAVALGIMTRAQADARLEAVALAQTMTSIGEAIRSGAITPERAAELFDSLTTAAQGTAADLKIAIDRIKAEIAGIDIAEANVDETVSTSAAGLKRAMLEMEGVLQPMADDAQSKLDTLNETDIVVTVVDTELVDLKSLMMEVNEKQGIITTTVTKPPGDDSALEPVKASLSSILDMIAAINSTEVNPGSTAGGRGGGSGSGSSGSGGGGGGGVPGTAAAAAGGGVPGTAAPPATAPPAAGPAGRGPAGQTTNNVFNNYSTGLGPAAVAAMIASSMTRYTRGAR